ncbi:hypothetical protein AQF52_0613 [Streptomyces venezuelae]|uniref:DUF4345 domain-containing protein n=1 Tax=Streptomyces gardneri TaxID=66892 RepID=UPI0006BCEB19|nr:DUF4345 domain-containing protein [Streptomyces gardneri]ALO06210.1 hypothetical protein AQF52_0613 [Streptomyces venezuelae]QPK43675.1 DUF4345 domain-containing protein [Streptomyces gardneri]WRK34930.1 DUF4345 domain-containing protein [Streptomyces venezuelae]CUM43545.1 hypothetical protein BN2537_16055 [Streptomyces venezuelae]
MTRAKTLRGLVLTMGYACVAIGIAHVLLGNASIPGAESAGPTIDSLGRFFGAIFAGYGLAWLWAARQRPIPATAVRLLTAVFLLGAVGRLLSLAVEGRPHAFQMALAALELALSPLLFWLADAEEKAHPAPHVPGATV